MFLRAHFDAVPLHSDIATSLLPCPFYSTQLGSTIASRQPVGMFAMTVSCLVGAAMPVGPMPNGRPSHYRDGLRSHPSHRSRICLRKARVRLCLGWVKISSADPISTIAPLSINTTR